MITATTYLVNRDILTHISEIQFEDKLAVNESVGNFFYDPWKIKQNFVGTAIEQALTKLPHPIGEARLIKLKSGTCYFSHSDIDDRYHLNISGDCAALVNLETKENFFLSTDGVWYDMDAGLLHSAVNFGQYDRVQLVVRKLLKRNMLNKPIKVNIKPTDMLNNSINVNTELVKTNSRFVFDNTVSPWLNQANKLGKIKNFSTNGQSIELDIDEIYINELLEICPKNFNVSINEVHRNF
jgi:hypothetical protein